MSQVNGSPEYTLFLEWYLLKEFEKTIFTNEDGSDRAKSDGQAIAYNKILTLLWSLQK